jgi:hypothetical protein
MKKNIVFSIAVLLLSLIFVVGCEIGVNPLILDSSVSESVIVDQASPIPYPLEIPFPLTPLTVNTKSLQDVAGNDIEKINFYKLTLMVDQNTTPDTGKISGRLMVDGDTLVAMNNLLLSLFKTERSIFENIPGFEVKNKGVGKVLQAVKNPPPNGIALQMFVGPTNTPVHFRLWVKVYGQIQTKAK